MLEPYGIQCGNIPIGMWRYPHQSEVYKQNSLKNEASAITKVCGVFETLGEKRAGTHLIQGLNMIIYVLS